MRSKLYILSLLIILPFLGYPQQREYPVGLWRLTHMNGEVKLKTEYRSQERVLQSGFSDKSDFKYFGAGLILNTQSYIWHPNFMTLNVNAQYNSEANRDDYIVIPDRSETRSLKKLSINSVLFPQKFISLSSFLDLSETYVSYENLSNTRSNDKRWGGVLSLKNKFAPISVSYQKNIWHQNELQTDRKFRNRQSNLMARISKSFFEYDRNELSYSIDKYFREDVNLYEVHNRTNTLDFHSFIYLDKHRNSNINTQFTNYERTGTDTLKRLQFTESFNIKLPANFKLGSSYFYQHIDENFQNLTQNTVKGRLEHSLFLSLKSNVYYEYHDIQQSTYHEINQRYGLGINYTKKIPVKGRLNLSYHLYKQHVKMDSDPSTLYITNEEYQLSDADITLINRAFVDITSINITDESGSIIYQENFDYLLIQRDSYIEIQRIPGGQIADGSTIYVDYSAQQSRDYTNDLTNQTFDASISILNRFVECYYRFSKQDYDASAESEFLSFEYYKQNLYGIRFTLNGFRLGAELDDYDSNIVPYRLKKYYLNLQGKWKHKFSYLLTANFRDYDILAKDENQKYFDVSGQSAYQFSPKTKINLQIGYRKQLGNGIDLSFNNAKLELTTLYRKLYFTVGSELYRRNYLNEEINYIGGYFSVTRKF